MAAGHLRPLLDSIGDSELLLELCFAPVEMIALLRVGRITVLQKPSGGKPKYCGEGRFQGLVARDICTQKSNGRHPRSSMHSPLVLERSVSLMSFKFSLIWARCRQPSRSCLYSTVRFHHPQHCPDGSEISELFAVGQHSVLAAVRTRVQPNSKNRGARGV